MLSKVALWCPLKLNLKSDHHEIKKRSSSSSSSLGMRFLNPKSSSTAVGLRILTAETTSLKDSNVVINSGLKLIKPIFRMNQFQSPNSCSLDSCFLKSCFLCNKTLSLDKDVYMYRGDQGFCSVECRSRQIYLDEIREIEKSTKQALASFRRCRDSNWCETKNLREEFGHQRHRQPIPCQKGPIFTLS